MVGNAELMLLSKELEGELYFDDLHKAIYATDASVYRQLPLAVAYPVNNSDIKKLVLFACRNRTSLIPRTAGTSLAGQCVGDGIVVDVSRYFTRIHEIDHINGTVTVDPGVIRDELNMVLREYGYFFGPNTSTANRCMLGGMVGNNSSGSTSIRYGVTRDKVLEIEAILADGSEVVFKELSEGEFIEKTRSLSLEGQIYNEIFRQLSPVEVQNRIREQFPKPEIHRRNTGYAIDELLKLKPFDNQGENFNMCKLLAGSEGTLGFTTKLKLKLDKLPPLHSVLIAPHFETVEKACEAVAPVMDAHNLYACELMDKVILDCTKNNKSQLPNRFFIEGDPGAILMLEISDNDQYALENQKNALLKTLENSGLSYANPVLYGDDIEKAFELRKAGLGLLGNIVGDNKAVACIEDTAVAYHDLSDYIGEFTRLMKSYGQSAVYYAHAGAGELHLRPILNLKKSTDVQLFRKITTDVAHLVKKYHGSMSGEHGDGRVRAEFIKTMIGDENYEILNSIKRVFDKDNIFNPGKIVNAVPMDAFLRYEKDREEPAIETLMDFTDSEGILKAAEKCNGSGDCRKTHLSKGVMCPSYQATKNEKDTTRARANALREFLTNSEKHNRFDHKELKEVFDLCLSCKGCSSECPSNVDVATLKSEFLYQYQLANGSSIRDKAFAYNTRLNKFGSFLPGLVNNQFSSAILKKVLGIAGDRNLPKISSFDFKRYLDSKQNEASGEKGELVLYVDEFLEYIDIQTGKDAIDLLIKLGYKVSLFHGESGRTFISKGFLKEAKQLADENIDKLKNMLSADRPLVGIEPSAILSFRDEYLRLAKNRDAASYVAKHSLLIEEFLANEVKKGNITSSSFTTAAKQLKIHGHCHQKSLSNIKVTFDILNLPENYSVSIINSGCCGMAGSFGYEKEHYELSMTIGEQRLFPAVRKSEEATIISANGTSCRHQIFDGTQRVAKHPVSILKEALI